MKSLRILIVLVSAFYATNLCAMEHKRKLSVDEVSDMDSDGERPLKIQKFDKIKNLGTFQIFQELLIEQNKDTFIIKASACINGFSRLITNLEKQVTFLTDDTKRQEILKTKQQLEAALFVLKARLLQVQAEREQLNSDVDALIGRLANLTVVGK